jgi:PAS domain S-box-containing protein
VTYVNRAYLDFFGTTLDEVAGMGWTKFVQPDDIDGYMQAYTSAFERREPLGCDVRLLRADGRYRWMRTSGQPLGVDRYVGVCLDITEAREITELLEVERQRQAFLPELGDALRDEASADAMAERALRMLRDRLGLDRCYVGVYRLEDDRGDFPYPVARDGLPRLPATVRPSDFPEALKVALGGTLVIEDVARDPQLSRQDRENLAGLGFGALAVATLRKGPGRPLWSIVAVCGSPRRWTSSEIALIEDVTERTWSAMERARTEAALSESEHRLRLGVEVARFALWDWDIRTGEVTWSDEHFRMQGYEVGEVAPSYGAWAARVHPDDLRATEAALARARDSHTEFVREFRSLHPDGSARWLCARGRFFYDETGRAVRMIGAMLDTIERREWEDRQQVLVAELQHRTRNIMGVVRAMFERTRRDSPDIATLNAKYADRLAALARVQNLLSRLDDADRITFDELIRAELSAMGAIDADGRGLRVSLDGPHGVRMRSSTVQTFALAMHELATNANKYGALAQPEGHLAVRWRLEQTADLPRLCIEWVESGVDMPPPGAAPRGGGYGRELIERALPYQLNAKTKFELGRDGVRCTIEMPVSAT